MKLKRHIVKSQKVLVMNNIIKYKKIIRPKNLHKVGFENLGICLGNSSYDGYLKKKKKNSVRYSSFVLEKKKQIFEDNF